MLQRCMEIKQRIVADCLTPRKETPMDEVIQLVEQWGERKGIIEHSRPESQVLKLMSEVGELADAIAKDDASGAVDAIGDCTVVLILLSRLLGLRIESCLRSAYEEIKDRKGYMSAGGVFVKEETPS